MDEQNVVRGQGFTLMVFGGLVALCAVFFILGMVVGRSQVASGVDAIVEAVPAAQPEEEAEPELEFYDAVTQDDLSESADPEPSIPAPAPPAIAVAEPVEAPVPEPPEIDEGAIMLQLGAFSVEATADNLAAQVRARGFGAFVSRPNGTSALHRVQVGPFTSEDEAQRVRSQLDAADIEAIIVR